MAACITCLSLLMLEQLLGLHYTLMVAYHATEFVSVFWRLQKVETCSHFIYSLKTEIHLNYTHIAYIYCTYVHIYNFSSYLTENKL
jgi:hypothetical protein